MKCVHSLPVCGKRTFEIIFINFNSLSSAIMTFFSNQKEIPFLKKQSVVIIIVYI